MSKGEILTMQDVCEMTVVPGGIMACARSQAAAVMLDDFVTSNNDDFNLLKKKDFLSVPIQIDALNRSVTLTFKPLSHEYDKQIMNFKSNYSPLLQFLRADSFAYEEIGNTCTTLFFDEDVNNLVAFCSTKCSSLKIKGRKIRSLCPSVEIAALCVDEKYRYMGIGQAIFNHIIQQISKMKEIVGVQVVTLFAIPDAVAFYKKLSFRKLAKGMRILDSPAHEQCIPMYLVLPSTNIDKR